MADNELDIRVVDIDHPSQQMMCSRHPDTPIIWRGDTCKTSCAKCDEVKDYVVRRMREAFSSCPDGALSVAGAVVRSGNLHEYITLTLVVEPEKKP